MYIYIYICTRLDLRYQKRIAFCDPLWLSDSQWRIKYLKYI